MRKLFTVSLYVHSLRFNHRITARKLVRKATIAPYIQPITMQSKIVTSLKMLCMAVLLHQPVCAYAELHGTITGTTNYVWRMYSKSNNEPAIQANLDYQHSSGLYLGTSVSSFNIGPSEVEIPGVPNPFSDSAKIEMTPYIGFSYKLADDWRVDAQYSRYIYDGKIYGVDGDYNEFYVFLHYKDLLTAQFSYVDDFYGIAQTDIFKFFGEGQDANSFFYELTGRYPITDYLEFSSTYGYAQTQGILGADYQYWNVGLTGRYKFIALDLRYYDAMEVNPSDELVLQDHPHTLTESVVFSISAGF
jgi:uncharacterized protein (TIGR02001 family)